MNPRRAVEPIRLMNAALDEVGDDIVLRGVIDPKCLSLLQVDEYQREAAPLTALSGLISALEGGDILPDIELGMRGQKYSDGSGTFNLRDPVFIIDGQQRVNAALQVLRTNPGAEIRLGATVHFDTDKAWERDRFRVLNTLRSKVSPNVILRNRQEESSAIGMLYALTNNDKTFVMKGRVSWGQRMSRGELISALTLAKVVGSLHSHRAPGRRTQIDELVPALDKAVEVVGIQNMRNNIKAFFDLIDMCWGVRAIQYREGAVFVKGNFLQVLARILSDHHDFWNQPDEKQLSVEVALRRKIALFPVHDPQVINLGGSGGKSRDILYVLMRNHINSGKRTKRLRSRTGEGVDIEIEDDGEE